MSALANRSDVSTTTDSMIDGIDVDRFLADPSECFGQSQTRLMSLPVATLDSLQLMGLKRRFAQLRDRVPMVQRLSDSEGIQAIERIEDVLPLLFDHSTYKSYPGSLLEKRRFDQLTLWLDKLTAVDLSGLDVSSCRSIDEWMTLLREKTPLSVCHTSGTSGTFSFLPWSKREWHAMTTQFLPLYFHRFGVEQAPLEVPLNMPCVYPSFRSGGMSHTIVNDYIVELIAGTEENFHAAFPQRLSADLLYFAAKRRAAEAAGTLDRLVIPSEIESRRAEFELQQREMPQRVAAFTDDALEQLGGQRVFMMATSNLLYDMAIRGLARGSRNIFHPASVILTGGGGKGMVLPNDWQQPVQEFLGIERVQMCYGMSEITTPFAMCEHGHYHGNPWIISFLLDPATNQPLPRSGTQTGRYAFFDLLLDTRWGGFITGDEVTVTWDALCACGRTTPYLHGKIQRLSQKARYADGEEKISCASTVNVYEEALDFLNGGLG